jgi:hypothetical protein
MFSLLALGTLLYPKNFCLLHFAPQETELLVYSLFYHHFFEIPKVLLRIRDATFIACVLAERFSPIVVVFLSASVSLSISIIQIIDIRELVTSTNLCPGGDITLAPQRYASEYVLQLLCNTEFPMQSCSYARALSCYFVWRRAIYWSNPKRCQGARPFNLGSPSHKQPVPTQNGRSNAASG